MIVRLPFRLQIPLGLTLAVLLTALTMGAAFTLASVQRERMLFMESITRAQELLTNQVRSLILSDDVWALYKLLRETSAMLRSSREGKVRLAVLDADFHVLASSDPEALKVHARLLPWPQGETVRASSQEKWWASLPDGQSLRWTTPVRSDDEQVIGHLWLDVDPSVFAPQWATTGLLAGGVASVILLLLVPLGWHIGQRMAHPVVQIANCIEAIGSAEQDCRKACDRLPSSVTPEVQHIADAVRRLASEMNARRDAEQRAMSAQRLAALGRLTAAVAHEINNPLAGLMTNVQTLRLKQTDPAQRERALGLMERGLQQLRTVVAALLPHARGGDRMLTRDDVRDTITLAQAASALNDVDCQLQLPAAEIPPAAPASLWRQALLNLLLNALRAAGPAGWVRARLDVEQNRIVFQIANSGARLDRQRLHDAIAAETGPDPRGYGLWICHQLAIRHGGQFISAEEAAFPLPALDIPGNGMMVTHLIFWLPLSAAPNHEHETAFD